MKKSASLLLLLLCAAILALSLFYNRPRTPDPSLLIADGYGGPIEMELVLSDQGAVQSLQVIRHNETTSYIYKLKSFLAQFTGRTALDPLVLGKDIDAISGATITSQAITDAVRGTLQARPENTENKNIPITPIILCVSLWAMAIAAFSLRNNAWRWAVMTGGFVYFGIMTHTMLSIIQVVQAGLWHAPSFPANPLWWLLVVLTFTSALILGRIYCGSLCPFALVQEVLHFFIRHKDPRTEQVSPSLDRKARWIKYILLLIIISICATLGTAAAANIEPFITFFTGYSSKLALALLTLVLILAVFSFRFWCKYLCPVGALTSLAAALSPNKIRPTASCTACGQCSQICPTQAITPDAQGVPCIDTTECILCAKCLRLCPANALTFGCVAHEKK